MPAVDELQVIQVHGAPACPPGYLEPRCTLGYKSSIILKQGNKAMLLIARIIIPEIFLEIIIHICMIRSIL